MLVLYQVTTADHSSLAAEIWYNPSGLNIRTDGLFYNDLA